MMYITHAARETTHMTYMAYNHLLQVTKQRANGEDAYLQTGA